MSLESQNKFGVVIVCFFLFWSTCCLLFSWVSSRLQFVAGLRALRKQWITPWCTVRRRRVLHRFTTPFLVYPCAHGHCPIASLTLLFSSAGGGEDVQWHSGRVCGRQLRRNGSGKGPREHRPSKNEDGALEKIQTSNLRHPNIHVPSLSGGRVIGFDGGCCAQGTLWDRDGHFCDVRRQAASGRSALASSAQASWWLRCSDWPSAGPNHHGSLRHGGETQKPWPIMTK